MLVNVSESGAVNPSNGRNTNENNEPQDYKSVYEVVTEALAAIKAAQERHNK